MDEVMASSVRTWWLLAVLACLALGSSPAWADEAATRTWQVPAPSLGSEASTVEVAVHWPAAIDSDDVAPDDAATTAWAVFLHGWGGDHHTWRRLGGPRLLAELVAADGLEPLVVVAPDGGNGGWVDWRDGSWRWQSFLARDLPAAVASRLRLRPEPVAVLGTSMGGVGALLLGLEHPDRFPCVAAHSAALHPADPAELPAWARRGMAEDPSFARQVGWPPDPATWRRHNVLHRAGDLSATTAPRGLYFDVGVDDPLGFARTNAELGRVLASRGVPHVFALRPGGHGDDFTSANLRHSLRFLAQCLQKP